MTSPLTSPRRRDRAVRAGRKHSRQPLALTDVLTRVVKAHGWQERLRHEEAVAAWPAIVGTQLAHQTVALGVRDATLHVAVRAGVWAAQLAYFRTELLQRVRARGYSEIRDLIFHVRHESEYTYSARPDPWPRALRPQPFTPLPCHLATAAALTADAGELGQQLARLYLAAMSRASRLAK